MNRATLERFLGLKMPSKYLCQFDNVQFLKNCNEPIQQQALSHLIADNEIFYAHHIWLEMSKYRTPEELKDAYHNWLVTKFPKKILDLRNNINYSQFELD